MGLSTFFKKQATEADMDPQAQELFAQFVRDLKERLVLLGYDAYGDVSPVSYEQDKAHLYVAYNNHKEREVYKLQCDRSFSPPDKSGEALKIKIAPENTWGYWRGISVDVTDTSDLFRGLFKEDSVNKAVEQMVSYIRKDIDLVVRGKIDQTISYP